MRFPTTFVLIPLAIASVSASAVDEARLTLGKKIFNENCKSCHETGKPKNDAPQISETDEWKNRLGGGRDALYKTSIDGFTGYFTMPPKGGNSTLTNDEVKAAVDYMLDKAGIR